MSTLSAWAEGVSGRPRDWTAESQCLIHLMRAALDAGELRDDLRPHCAAIRVPILMQLIRRHRVGAFLFEQLSTETVKCFAPQFGQRLKLMASRNHLKAYRQSAALIRLTERFAGEGLEVKALKGPLLAQDLYGGQGIRHAGDIDFSIKESEVQRIDRILVENGYQRTCPLGEMTSRRWEKYIGVWRDCEYWNAAEQLSVEVMWRLANSDALQGQVEALPPVEQSLGGHRIKALPREIHQLYLLVHGAHHGWFRWFWLVDIAQLMKTPAVDWKSLQALALSCGVENHFWQGLNLAHELFTVAWPPGLEKPVPDQTMRSLIADAYWQMEITPQEIRFGKSHVRLGAYARCLMPDRLVRRRERSKRWISPDNWKLLPLPDRWFWLYYVLWPGLWAWRQAARRLRPKPAQPDPTRQR